MTASILQRTKSYISAGFLNVRAAVLHLFFKNNELFFNHYFLNFVKENFHYVFSITSECHTDKNSSNPNPASS